MQCIYQAAKALETGAFGAKNHSSRRINFIFSIWPDQAGAFGALRLLLVGGVSFPFSFQFITRLAAMFA